MTKLEKMIAVVPSERQLQIQEMGFYFFIHFGLNTMTGKEWGNGKVPPGVFNPTELDTDQWAEACKSAGAKGIILTAKHHDGFCLWPCKYTDYTVASSPYKNGKGDIVKEMQLSCEKYGLKLGLYLSPWDRNSEYYATPKYNDFYIKQLTELCTDYGDLFCIWLDGACGSYMDGKPKQIYDFERIYDTVRKLQPNACIDDCGPDVRWVGNEAGEARESEWCVVPRFVSDTQAVEEKSQQSDDANFVKKVSANCHTEDLGSREFLERYDEYMWYPAEVNVSIRMGWFYHKSQDCRVKKLNHLLHIYYSSYGSNSLFLLNIPPDKKGRIAAPDIKRLKEFGDRIKSAFSKKIDSVISAPKGKKGMEEDKINISVYSPSKVADSYRFDIKFDKKSVDKVVLKEDTRYSQRIERFEISTVIDGESRKLYEGTVVGMNKIALFYKPVKTDNLTVTVTRCRFEPYILTMEAYEWDGIVHKPYTGGKLWRAILKFGGRLYEKREAKRLAKLEKKGYEVVK